MKHGPRSTGPRHYRIEVLLSDSEVAEVHEHSGVWGLTAAAAAREAMLLGFALFQLRGQDVDRRLARLNPNPPVVSPRETA